MHEKRRKKNKQQRVNDVWLCLLGAREKVHHDERMRGRAGEGSGCGKEMCRWSTLIIIMKAIIVIVAFDGVTYGCLHYHQRLIGRQIVAHTHTHTRARREWESGKRKRESERRTCLLVTLLVLRPFRSFLSAPMQASQSLRRRRRFCAALYATQFCV